MGPPLPPETWQEQGWGVPRGGFLKKFPWMGRLFVFRRLPLPLAAAPERDGEDQGYAGKLSFFPLRTGGREWGAGMTKGSLVEGTASHAHSRGLDAGLGRDAGGAAPGLQIISWGWGRGPGFRSRA